MSILFITPYGPEGPSSRFRVWQYIPLLSEHGFKVTVSPLLTSYLYKNFYRRGNWFVKIMALIIGIFRRILDTARAPFFDIIFLQREAFPIGPPVFEWLIAMLNSNMIFDFDDALFLPNTSVQNSRWLFLKSKHKITTNIKRARMVLAGNHYLANFARPWNQSVTILSTPVDTNRFCLAQKNPAIDRVIIGWIGSRTTSKYLAEVEEPLSRLKSDYGNSLQIRLVGADDFHFSRLSAEYLPWKLETEVEYLHSFDIGIMPMPDNEWTRGKCGFKALQYSSVGIPAVCSNVGMNADIITEGETGFLVRSAHEWYEKLKIIIENAQLRQKMGKAGRQFVEKHYSLKGNVDILARLIRRQDQDNYTAR